MSVPLDLPMPVSLLVPHRKPVCVIDRLIEFKDDLGLVESIISPDSMFVKDDGTVEQTVLVELIAQSFAAVKGYTDLLEGRPIKKGFLVEVKNFSITGAAYGGDRLSIAIKKIGGTNEFALADGQVMRHENSIASGRVMVWIPGEE